VKGVITYLHNTIHTLVYTRKLIKFLFQLKSNPSDFIGKGKFHVYVAACASLKEVKRLVTAAAPASLCLQA